MTCTVYICWRRSFFHRLKKHIDLIHCLMFHILAVFDKTDGYLTWSEWWEYFDLIFVIVFTFTFYSLIDKTDGYLVWPCTKCSHRSDRETLIWFADRWPSLPQMDSSQCWWSLYLGGQQKTPASMLGVKQKFCRK